MTALVIHFLILTGLIISAGLVVYFRDLLSAAIASAAFSLLLSFEFYVLQAPDVAIAEAGIGAGLTTAIFIIAILTDPYNGRHGWFGMFRTLPVYAIALILTIPILRNRTKGQLQLVSLAIWWACIRSSATLDTPGLASLSAGAAGRGSIPYGVSACEYSGRRNSWV